MDLRTKQYYLWIWRITLCFQLNVIWSNIDILRETLKQFYYPGSIEYWSLWENIQVQDHSKILYQSRAHLKNVIRSSLDFWQTIVFHEWGSTPIFKFLWLSWHFQVKIDPEYCISSFENCFCRLFICGHSWDGGLNHPFKEAPLVQTTPFLIFLTAHLLIITLMKVTKWVGGFLWFPPNLPGQVQQKWVKYLQVQWKTLMNLKK